MYKIMTVASTQKLYATFDKNQKLGPTLFNVTTLNSLPPSLPLSLPPSLRRSDLAADLPEASEELGAGVLVSSFCLDGLHYHSRHGTLLASVDNVLHLYIVTPSVDNVLHLYIVTPSVDNVLHLYIVTLVFIVHDNRGTHTQ